MAIGLGFDAVNGEHNRRTLSRILAQPIYRDALLIGKFLAGLATLGSMLLCLWLLVIGFGLLYLGVPPGTEEIARSFVFLLVALAYCGVWLALAMLLSILFRSAATARAGGARRVAVPHADLADARAGVLAQVIAPPDFRYQMLGLPTPATVEWQTILARVLAEPVVRRMRAGDPVAANAGAGPDLCRAIAGRGGRLRSAAVAKPADRLAADGGTGRRHDRAVRGRLHRVPAPGSQSLTLPVRAGNAANRRSLLRFAITR